MKKFFIKIFKYLSNDWNINNYVENVEHRHLHKSFYKELQKRNRKKERSNYGRRSLRTGIRKA